jgi:hypothetical protein
MRRGGIEAKWTPFLSTRTAASYASPLQQDSALGSGPKLAQVKQDKVIQEFAAILPWHGQVARHQARLHAVRGLKTRSRVGRERA